MSAQVGDVITTAEELDWLPDWSAVVDAQGDVAQRLPGGRWFYPDSSPVTTSKASKYGPFTVLYLPGTPPRPERVVKGEALREAAQWLDDHDAESVNAYGLRLMAVQVESGATIGGHR